MAQKQSPLHRNMNKDNQYTMQHHTDNSHIEEKTKFDSFGSMKSGEVYPDSKGKGFETYLMTGDMIIRTSVPQGSDQTTKPVPLQKQKVLSQPFEQNTHSPVTDQEKNKICHSKIPQPTHKNMTEKKTHLSRIPKATAHKKESLELLSRNQDTVTPQVVPCTPPTRDIDWYNYSNISGQSYPELDIPPDDISSEDDAYKTLDTCLDLDDLPPPPADLLIQRPLNANEGDFTDQVVPETECFVPHYGHDFTQPGDMFQNTQNTRVQEGLCSCSVNDNLVSEHKKCDSKDVNLPAESCQMCHQNKYTELEQTKPNVKGMVRTSKSHENYLESNRKETPMSCIDIDFDDNKASSVDVLHYGSISMEPTQCSNCTAENEINVRDTAFKSHICPENTQSDSALPNHTSPTHKALQTSDGIILDLDSISDVSPYTVGNGTNQPHGEQGLNSEDKQTPWSPENYEQPSIDVESFISQSVTPAQVAPDYLSSNDDYSGSEVDSNEEMFKNNYTEDSQYSDTDSICQPVYKDVDQPSAARLAKRLFLLDGFKKQDISRHLGKK